MKLDQVKILTQTFSAGVRHWWTATIVYGDQRVDVQQDRPMSLTHDGAMENARLFAALIDAKFVEPVAQCDPCL